MSAADARCPECGAHVPAAATCWELLGNVLAWESRDAELQREHFLTVASYNLQHPAQFTDDAVAGLRTAFVDHLDRGVTVAEIRRRASVALDGSARVRRPESDRRPVLREWPMTIADVFAAGDPRGAAVRVRRWARAIRASL